MKKTLIVTVIIMSCYAVFVFVSGFISMDEEKIKTSQEDLDKSTTPVQLSVTGTAFGSLSVAHNGRNISADSTFRDSYTNMSSPQGLIKEGTVFTKRVYMKDKKGAKGNLEMIFAMIKREKGYFPSGGDWEYVMISYDKTTDYKMHPNGMLPATIDHEMRGKISSCGSCHIAAAGNDFIFTNSTDTKPKKGMCDPKMKCNPCKIKMKCTPCSTKTKCNPCKPK